MKRAMIVGLFLLAAGCGAQSDPIRPTANIGLSVGSEGITPSASVGAQSGPFTLGINL